MKNLKGWKIPIIAGLGLLIAVYSVLGRPSTPARDPSNSPPKSEFNGSVAGIGVIEPKSEMISLGVEIPGVVREVKVKVGDNVKAGALLFSLDQRDVDAQIATLEKTLESTKIQAEDADAQFEIVSTMKDTKAISKDDFNRRKFGKQLASAKVEELKSQIAQAKITKERLNIKAPITGKILAVNVRPGEYASAGAIENPLIRMGDVSTLYVRVEIDEENSHRIKAESSAEGMLRGDTATKYPLTFVRFEPYIRPKQNLAVAGQRVDTRVLQIIYALPAETASMFVGQQMDVFIKENN